MKAETQSPPESWPRLLALISWGALLGFAYGYSLPALGLIMEREGIEAGLIGLNSGSQNLAILVIGPFVLRLLRRLGLRRTMYLMIGIATASVLALIAVAPPYGWFPFRIVMGGAEYVAFIAGETWISQGAGAARRGRVTGLYASVLAGGIFAGPLLLQLTGTAGVTPMLVTAAIIATAAIPLLVLTGPGPAMDQPVRGGLLAFMLVAPTVMAASLLNGVVDATLLSMLPIYGLHGGLQQGTAFLLLTVWIAGAISLQLPLGRLGDRLGRRRVLVACGSASLAASILIPLLISGGAMLWIALFVWGGAIMGLWTISIAILGDRFQGAELATATTAYAMFYAAGATAGPSLAGAAMEAWDPHGMMAVLGMLSALFVGLALYRATRRIPAATNT